MADLLLTLSTMGQRIRWWRDDVIYESTISCIDRQFLFVPNHRSDNPLLHGDCPANAFDLSNDILPVPSTINIIGSSVARALDKHPIQLHWFESSINHLHKGFSLLPYQLVPYHRYTLESMVFALLLWSELQRADDSSGSGYSVSETLSWKSRVSSSHLYVWLYICGEGLRRRHSELGNWYDLSGICFGESLRGRLDEFYQYSTALCLRGPPRKDALRRAAIRYGIESGGFLIGVPSQERRRRVSP